MLSFPQRREEAGSGYYTRKTKFLTFYKEQYYEYRQSQSIFYVVYDSERSVDGFFIADMYICQRLGLPDTQQIVFHFPGNVQRGDILVPRPIQDVVLYVHSYPIHSLVDNRIN